MKNLVTGIVGFIAATLISLSQEAPVNPVAEKAPTEETFVPPTLPAMIELVGAGSDRKDMVKVLSIAPDKKSIVIEYLNQPKRVPITQFNAATIKKLTGKITVDKPISSLPS
jgi:hypothetical protein